jgi:aspartate aminotransferase
MVSSTVLAPTARVSPNLALDELVAARRAAGVRIVHLGFGESRIPVFPGLVEQLARGAGRSGYGPVAGERRAREAVAGYFARRRLPTGVDQVVLAPGSKPLLLAAVVAGAGDVLLPTPSWVTYRPQARIAGRRAFGVPVPRDCGGVPDPEALREAIGRARRAGGDPRTLVLTLPDNPTGTLAPPDLVRAVCAVAEQEDLLVVSDEIYRDTLHDPAAELLSPAEVVGHRTVVTTGLSKSHGLGGWRIGAARLPEGPRGRALRAAVVALASEVWSTLAGPMQQVVTYAYGEPPELRAHVARCTRLHAVVTSALHGVVTAAGADCRPPAGGFYLYPDLGPIWPGPGGPKGAAALQELLLDAHGVAVLGGHHFGDDPCALRVRLATSLLHGETDDQRHAALAAEDPLAVPHVRGVLRQLGEVFSSLAHGAGSIVDNQ